MRKTISLWMLGIVAMLASCSQNEEMLPTPTTDGQTAQVTISVQAPGTQTRAAVDQLKRYFCEVYEGTDATGARTARYAQDNGNFAIELKKNTAYTFLFWADYGQVPGMGQGTYYYTVDNLKEVSITGNLTEDAYCGKIENKIITGADNIGFDVTLRHATAKVIYENTVPFTADYNSFLVTYANNHKLNVATGEIEEWRSDPMVAFDVNYPDKKEIGIDYVLAPADEALLLTVKTQINIEPLKTLTNVPLQANHVTRIKGAFSNKYSTTFTVSTEVEDMSGENKDF